MGKEENKEEKMEKIAVVVRVRPLLKGESTQRSPWKLSSKSIASSKTCRPPVPSYSFTYDRVYGTKGTTSEIYQAHVKGIIYSAVSGVSGTIIAHGQPGSGKTSTIRGLPEESGVLELAVQDVFKSIQEEKDREYLVRVSYFELDNEELVDLLASKNQKLDVHEHFQGGIVAGLREEIVVGTEQVLALLEYADARRFVGPKNANDCKRRPHSIFQMVIESRLDNQEYLLIPGASDAIQISVLNLVEVAAANTGIVDNDGIFLEERKPDKSLITLDTVISKLSENAETEGESLPYAESKLTWLLKPSLGGNTRTCFICHVSPAMVHLDSTVATLTFAAKATKVMNCFKAVEFSRSRPILKRQRRETEEPRNKCKEEDYSQELEDVVHRQNALLMIELEREQMSTERFGKGSLLCGSETIEHTEDQKGGNLLLEGDFRCESRNEMQQDDCSTYSQTKALCGYIEKFRQNEELQDADHLLRQASGELWLSPRSGSKRKRRSFTGKVAEKFEQVELLFQSKMARGLNFLKAEGIAERQLLLELRNLIEQQDNEHQEHLAQKAGDCKKLQQKIAELEKEKVMMEKRLCEQGTTFNEAVESLKCQFDTEERQVYGDLSVTHSDDAQVMMEKRLCEQETTFNEAEESLKGQLHTEGRQEHGDLSVIHSDNAQVMMEKTLCEQEPTFNEAGEYLKSQFDTEGRQEHGDLSVIHSDDAQVMMEKTLCEQETTFTEALESLKGQFDTEGRQVLGDSVIHSDDAFNPILPRDGQKRSGTSQNEANSNCVAKFEGEVQETGLEILGSVVKQHAESQSCISQESEEQQNVLYETEGKHTDTKRKSKANKVYQKYQNFQGRSEISNLRKELAIANETISALKDERDGLWRDLKQINASEDNVCTIKEDINGDNNSLQVLDAAVGELKAEVESSLSITDTLLELVLETFQTLNADLKSFQEGVAELNVLSCATSDLSESLEKAKLQLVALRQGKLSSEKELHSMKSELAKLECVVERQSGVLRVLSDNESLLNELSSVRVAMKEAASASELRLSAIEQEYKSKLEKLESQRENWKQENLQLEEKYSDIQSKLYAAQSEVNTLTLALEKKSELEKKQTDIQLKFDIAETDVRRLTQALEKSKVETKKKYSKSRQSTTEAEILRLTHSLGEKAGLQEEIKRLHADLSVSQTEVERLEREIADNDKARQEILIKLKSSEHTVVELTAELEEKERVEAAQGNKLVCMENEVVKVTKLLEDTLSRVELQQRELIISRGKAENLARQQEEMNTLENNYSKTLDRVVQSETEVARLTEIITSQLEDKSILEQDHTNFMYKLESAESEVASLATRLDTVLQERIKLEKESKAVSLQLSKSASEVARLKENLAREKKERITVEKAYRETLDKLAKEQEERKLLGNSNLELNCKLRKEQQREPVEEVYQELLENLTTDQEAKKKWEEGNRASSTHTQQEVEVVEMKHQGLLDNLASLETKVTQLTEKLAAETLGKSDLENKLQEIRDQLTKEHEQRKNLEEKNKDIVEQLVQEQQKEKERQLQAHADSYPKLASSESKVKKNQEDLLELDREREKREQLNKAHQDTLQKLAASQSEVAQLSETLRVKMQEYKILETEHLEILNKQSKNEQERNLVELSSAATSHEATAEEQDERAQLDDRRTALQFHGAPEAQLIQMTETLDRELREKKSLEEDRQQILDNLHKEQEDRILLQMKNQEILENMIRDEEQKRELLEKTNQTRVQNLGGSEAHVVQLRETVTRELEEKNRLEEHHQEILATLSREQQETRALEAKYEETLKKLTMAIEERDGLDKVQQNLLDKLAVSEAKVGQMAETLTTEVQGRLRLEHRYQEIIEELTSDREETLIQSNEEMAKTVSREREEAEMLKNNHQNCLRMLAGLEGKVVELENSLASEVQNKEKLELEYRKVLINFERLETEVATLTESLTSELQSKGNLEKHQNEFLAQLASSNAVVAKVNANLADEVAEKEKLRMAGSQMSTQIATLQLEVENLTKRIEETPQLNDELHNLQVKLAVSEAKLLRQADEQRESNTDEHKQLMVELDDTRAEIKALSNQNERLQQEQAELLAQVSILETEIRRLKDDVGEKGRVQGNNDINLKTEISDLEIALRDKPELEVEQQKLQLELLSSQGEVSKLTKALRVSRKVVKEQKTLIRNLTSNQAEVLRLTTALGGRSGSSKVYVEQNTATDPSVTGMPQSLSDEEQTRFQKRLESTEAEVARLLNVIEDKALAEKKMENVQLELTAAEAEVARLTAALEEKSRLAENFRIFQLKLSEAGLLGSRNETNGFQFSLEEFPSELIKMASRLEELKREGERKAVALADRERSMREKEIGLDVDYESLNTIITLREKERDELRERCTIAESKVHDLSVEIEKHKELCAVAESKVQDLSVEIQKHKALENVEKKLKAKCHKAEKDASDLRGKLQKLEEATAWLVRDKNLLEERVNCCEVQLAAAREAVRSANTELELSHHQLHVRTAQLQSEMAALCDELSIKKAQKAELEAELKRLLGQPHQPVRPLQEAPGYLSNPHFRLPQWQTGPSPNLDPTWGNGNR